MKKIVLFLIAILFITGCSDEKDVYLWTNNDGDDSTIQCTFFEVGKDLSAGNYKVEQINTAYDERQERIYSVVVDKNKLSCDDEKFLIADYYGGYGNKNEDTISVKDGEFINILKFKNGKYGLIRLTKID